MKVRVAAMAVVSLFLAGCTDADWDHVFSYAGLDPDNTPVAAAQETTAPAEQAAASNDSWCRDLAQSASRDAAAQGFDAATQQQRAQTSYKQCLTAPKNSVR
jgi:hypothetical protein